MAGLVAAGRRHRALHWATIRRARDRRVIARELAYLPQQYELAFPFIVEEVVLLGRYSQQSGLRARERRRPRGRARRRWRRATSSALATRRFDELSGGEARRVILAQALCQGAQCLLLDEPTDRARSRARARACSRCCARSAMPARAAVVVTHDLDLALRHGGTMWLVAGGSIAARGAPADVLGLGGDARGVRARHPRRRAARSGARFAVPA